MKTTGRQGRAAAPLAAARRVGALDPLRRQLTVNLRDSGSTRLLVLIALQTFPVRSGAHI